MLSLQWWHFKNCPQYFYCYCDPFNLQLLLSSHSVPGPEWEERERMVNKDPQTAPARTEPKSCEGCRKGGRVDSHMMEYDRAWLLWEQRLHLGFAVHWGVGEASSLRKYQKWDLIRDGRMRLNGSEWVTLLLELRRELANAPGKALVQSKGSGVWRIYWKFLCRAWEWNRGLRGTVTGMETWKLGRNMGRRFQRTVPAV